MLNYSWLKYEVKNIGYNWRTIIRGEKMSTIYIRKAMKDDLRSIMSIINHAKQLLKADGSKQWQNGNPNEQTILDDIEKGYCYLLIVDGQIGGTSALLTEPDPNYEVIFDGSWKNAGTSYATIHRIAISTHFRGMHLANYFLSNLISLAYNKGFRSLRVDTHEKNLRTQGLVQKFGFEYRGRIYVDSSPDGERKAYELQLV